MKSQVHALYMVWTLSITRLEAIGVQVPGVFADSSVTGQHVTGEHAVGCGRWG